MGRRELVVAFDSQDGTSGEASNRASGRRGVFQPGGHFTSLAKLDRYSVLRCEDHRGFIRKAAEAPDTIGPNEAPTDHSLGEHEVQWRVSAPVRQAMTAADPDVPRPSVAQHAPPVS